MRGNGGGSGGIRLDGVNRPVVEDSYYGYNTGSAKPALYIANAVSAVVKRMRAKQSMNIIEATASVGYLELVDCEYTTLTNAATTSRIQDGRLNPSDVGTVITIDPMLPPATQTNWSTIDDASGWVHGRCTSSGAQNATIGFDVYLPRGTWKIETMTSTANSFGVMTVAVDGVQVGATYDAYSAGSTPNVTFERTGHVVTTPGVKRISYTMATKNASSSSYTGRLQAIRLTRTA